ncbi:sensor histidine kinase [Geobacter sulfurreducens]|uniref:sensor histidine kinase n=1 Tax=Geobacter sulfurreducens TaxID=35554 RepID=UPI000DBAEFF7|nr:ATP-binding protein [Geobacter sulfurreducens]BBA71391.1 Phytochrome-like protein cph1 [Geobacter sulfurreducens]
MTIKRKVQIVIILIAIHVAVFVGYLFHSSAQVHTRVRHLIPAVEYLRGIALARAGMIQQMKEVVDYLAISDPAARDEFRKGGQLADESFAVWIDAIKAQRALGVTGEDDDLALVQEVQTRYASWVRTAEWFFELQDSGRGAEAMALFRDRLEPYFDREVLLPVDKALDDGSEEVHVAFHDLLMTVGRIPWMSPEGIRNIERGEAALDGFLAANHLLFEVTGQLKELMKYLLNQRQGVNADLSRLDWQAGHALENFRQQMWSLARQGDPTALKDAETVTHSFQELTGLMHQAVALKKAGRGHEAVALANSRMEAVLYKTLMPIISRSLDSGSAQMLTLTAAARWQGVLAVSLFLVMAVSLILGTSRSVLRALDSLMAGTSAIAEGDFSHRLDARRSDELGALAVSFNTMVERLQKSRRDLDSFARLLEQRVYDRTVQLEEANEDLRQFSSSLSHDIRTPLSSITGYVQLARAECDGNESELLTELFTAIELAAARMNALVDAQLALARATCKELNLEQVDMAEIGHTVIDNLQFAEPQRKVSFQVTGDLTVDGDMDLLGLAVENLLSNAWKYTAIRDEAVIEFGARDEGDRRIYFVRDNGAGFDTEEINRLFRPFSRLHAAEQFPGTGVGLATVARVIRRHGGRTWADGAVDRGATFFFTLNETPLPVVVPPQTEESA